MTHGFCKYKAQKSTYYMDTSVVDSYPKPAESIDASTPCKSNAETDSSPTTRQHICDILWHIVPFFCPLVLYNHNERLFNNLRDPFTDALYFYCLIRFEQKYLGSILNDVVRVERGAFFSWSKY
jgi:hypothetical protein